MFFYTFYLHCNVMKLLGNIIVNEIIKVGNMSCSGKTSASTVIAFEP